MFEEMNGQGNGIDYCQSLLNLPCLPSCATEVEWFKFMWLIKAFALKSLRQPFMPVFMMDFFWRKGAPAMRVPAVAGRVAFVANGVEVSECFMCDRPTMQGRSRSGMQIHWMSSLSSSASWKRE